MQLIYYVCSQPVEIRQTFSSVLRKCAHIVNNERKEIEMYFSRIYTEYLFNIFMSRCHFGLNLISVRLRQLTEGGNNPSVIWRLEEQKKQEERIQEMKMMQERHLSALQSREDAILAKQLLVNNSKLQAEKVRKEVTHCFTQQIFKITLFKTEFNDK